MAACGNHFLSGDTGYFHTPGFPCSYPEDLECEYTIDAPDDHTIIWEVKIFELEDEPNCAYDLLEIFDGAEKFGM